MRCMFPYAANESTHNNEARTNAILFIQTTPLLDPVYMEWGTPV